MLREKISQIVSLPNLIDGIMITDLEGIIAYYTNFRPDVNDLREQDVLGRHVFEVYPTLKEEESSIMQALKTGEVISNQYQELAAHGKKTIKGYNTTIPIIEGKNIVGVVEFSRYIDWPYERQHITISNEKIKEENRLYTIDDIVSSSRSMNLLKEGLLKSAKTDSTVLIYGETGTGKELVAQSIHTSSSRAKKKFISQNCAAIPSNLLEGILFGTTKGSYTDAIDRPGLFEVAEGGTIFLDEINSMDLAMQSKILKVIEEKRTTRIGGFHPKHFDVKIVAAVNEDPITCVKEGRLREDLFYRLGVVQLDIPPLRKRINDLFYLIEHFIHHYNEIMNRKIIGIAGNVEDLFLSYSWPGNVRELKNCIEGAFNMASSRMIEMKDLPPYLRRRGELEGEEPMKRGRLEGNLTELVEDYEKSLIVSALDTSPNLTEVAKKLGVSKQTLNYKLTKYKIEKNSI